MTRGRERKERARLLLSCVSRCPRTPGVTVISYQHPRTHVFGSTFITLVGWLRAKENHISNDFLLLCLETHAAPWKYFEK